MKMWKKLAACVLAAAMALTLLTACGGGGGSAGGTTNPTTKEDMVISYVQNYIKTNTGVSMSSSSVLKQLASDEMSDAVAYLDASRASSNPNTDPEVLEKYKALYNGMNTALLKLNTGGMFTTAAYEAMPTETQIGAFMKAYGVDSYIKTYGINEVGAAVTQENGLFYVVIIVARNV